MTWTSSKTDSELAQKYNLSYHVPYARMADQLVGLTNKDVLEVGGSLPREFALQDIGARTWISVESMPYWKETFSTGLKSGTPPEEKQQTEIITEQSALENYNYGVLYENIEQLPQNFYEKFDRVFSIAAFEHILRLPEALERMYDALRENGLLFALFAPVWSAHDGHHLPNIQDDQGRIFNFANSPVPRWGHLLMSPNDMISTLEPIVGRKTAQQIAYFVYKSPHINRYFTEDYEDFVLNSRFVVERFEPVFQVSIPQPTLNQLKYLYPRHNRFDNNGILIVLRKNKKHIKQKKNSSVKSGNSLDVGLIQKCTAEKNFKEAAHIIKGAMENGHDLKNMNVSLAHTLLLAADWNEISRLLPKDTNFFLTSGWLNSIECNRPINSDKNPIPWLTYPAIEFLDDIVDKSWVVFEWGCGNSTLWWASKVARIIAVEDNYEWFMEVKKQLPSNSDLLYRAGADYTNSIVAYPDNSFDAIIIDGADRTDAAKKCISKLKKSGIIIFDNSDAALHESAQRLLMAQGFYRIDFWGLRPSYLYKNCTSIYFREANILNMKNIPSNHQSSTGISCQQAIDKINIGNPSNILTGTSPPPEEDFKSSIKEDHQIKTALTIIANQSYAQFDAALAILKPLFSQLQNDFNVCAAVSFAAWVTHDSELCRLAAQRCIALEPKNSTGYLRLGLLLLGQQEYEQAFSALSTGIAKCQSNEGLKGWHRLSEVLMKNNHIARFNFDGIEYVFQLSVFNGQAMETAVSHVMGTLTKPQELRIVRKFIQHCDTIVEVGALVGNHTMFFAKTLQPMKIYVFDANPIAVEHINQTIALNDGPSISQTQFVVRNAAVAAKSGRMQFFGHDVEVVYLDDIIEDKVDFIKIDVDGMELEVLNGCQGIMKRYSPKIMVEVKRGLRDRFLILMEEIGYTVRHEIRRQCDSNFFIEPIAKPTQFCSLRNMIADIAIRHEGQSEVSVTSVKDCSFPNIKTMMFLLSSREAYRPVIFSINEVFCGPDCETVTTNGKCTTYKTSSGTYDVQTVINQLSLTNQMPELVVVKADATRRNFPMNLKAIECPKLLILGNTQHLDAPVQTLLQYALTEQFNFIMTDHKRHHLHYFKEAGFQNIFWLPGFNIYPHEQPHCLKKLYDVSFVGQVGRWHPYRRFILQFLKTNNLPVKVLQAPHEQAAEIYAKSLINLNISLNGDMNLRVFEILSSGGFLLTDRLSKESGLEMIFKDGEHLVCYDSPEDLLEKIHYYLNHPQEANAIARKGYEEYKRRHTPEIKTAELMDYIFKGRLNPLYDITQDKRSIYVTSPSRESLFARIAFYEYIQNLHLHNSAINLLFTPLVDPRILCDLSDLPRLKMYIRGNGSQIPGESLALFQNTGISDRLQAISDADIRNVQGYWDAVVMTAADLALDALEDFLITTNFKLLIFADDLTSIEPEQRQKLIDHLKTAGFEAISDNPVVYHWKNKNAYGEYLFSHNRTAEALKCFERALLDNPANEDALNDLGVISYNLGKYSAAENFFMRAAGINRRNPNTLDNLVQAYLTMERFEEAAGILKERIFMEPQQPNLHSLLGLCNDRLGRPQEAFEAYRKAYELDSAAFPIPPHMVSANLASSCLLNQPSIQRAARKILVINNLYPPQELGGYGRLLFDFTNILRRRGHAIYVLTSDTPYLGNTTGDTPDVDRSLELYGGWQGGVCKSIENREDIIRMIRKNLSRLQQILNEFQPDVCLLGNIDFLSKNIMDPILVRKIPVVHHLGNQSPGYAVAETPKSRFYHLATASNWLKNVIKRDGYPLKDISVVYPGAMVEEFRMRIPPAYDKLRIAYASILLPYKGPHILINALKRLNDLGIDFSCSMAGTTTDESFVNKLKEFITIHGMDDKIHFPGFLPREALKDLFARHNALVFPSIVKEAFGITQVEAMAAGLAVITSGTGGAREVVEHGVSGIIFKSEDDASLADELIGLAQDTQRFQSISLAGQRRAIEKFDIERSVDALESRFEILLNLRKR